MDTKADRRQVRCDPHFFGNEPVHRLRFVHRSEGQRLEDEHRHRCRRDAPHGVRIELVEAGAAVRIAQAQHAALGRSRVDVLEVREAWAVFRRHIGRQRRHPLPGDHRRGSRCACRCRRWISRRRCGTNDGASPGQHQQRADGAAMEQAMGDRDGDAKHVQQWRVGRNSKRRPLVAAARRASSPNRRRAAMGDRPQHGARRRFARRGSGLLHLRLSCGPPLTRPP